MNIVSKELMPAKASSSVRNALQIGQSQCNAITKERLKHEANIIVCYYKQK